MSWYNYWLEPEERRGQVSARAAKARKKIKEEAKTRGYPTSGDRYQKKSAANATVRRTGLMKNEYDREGETTRGYPHSGDMSQKQSASNANIYRAVKNSQPEKGYGNVPQIHKMRQKTDYSNDVRKTLKKAFKTKSK